MVKSKKWESRGVDKKAKTLRLEKSVRITDQVWPEGTVPAVSVFCITYNHAKFIRDAIEGFLTQETTFPVQIFVHDDASTDGTADIIQEYAGNYPRLFWTVLQKENQYSRGRTDVLVDFLLRQRGEFIAICEGDDYWYDCHKLQIQVEFLEKNPQLACSFHRTKYINESGATLKKNSFVPDRVEFDFRDCLVDLQKKYATSSMVFRTAALAFPKTWYLKSPNDMFLELQLASHGHIGFVDRNMGAYRKHRGGIWSTLSPTKGVLEMLYRYRLLLEDPETCSSYGTEIRHMMNKWEKSLCAKSECAAILSSQSIFHRIASILDYRCRLFAAYVRSLRRSSSN